MGSSEETVVLAGDKENNSEIKNVDEFILEKETISDSAGDVSENEVFEVDTPSGQDVSDSKEIDLLATAIAKKGKRKGRNNKKSHPPVKEVVERNTIRRVHYAGMKFKQGRKRIQTVSSISKFFLPHNRPRKDTFIPPTKFLLGGNISDPLNLNSLQDEDINRAMNAITPQSSPLPTPPRHKAKIDVIIPPNIRDPLNLMEPLDNEEYEKRLEMQQKKRKRPKLRRKTTETITVPQDIECNVTSIEEAPDERKEVLVSSTRKRSCSDSENTGQKCKDGKKLRRMDSLDKIVSPVVPQPGAWMRARAPPRSVAPERPASPRPKQSEGEAKLPTFHPKNSRYQYGNYDRYYGYRNLNAMMDIRLQVFEMNQHLFQNKDVLDIGCNVGHISIAIAHRYGARSVVGVDIDPVLIGRAKKSLNTYVPVPLQQKHLDEDRKVDECDTCAEDKCDGCVPENEKQDTDKEDGKRSGKKLKKPKKNRKAVGKQEMRCFFPNSFSMLYGPLAASTSVTTPEISQPTFPYNVTFKQGNYVPREEIAVGCGPENAQFDLILCLSTTKWMHLNWGDAGLKRAFRKMFADLRPGGKLVLEAQNWASYRKKKRLTPTIYENFNSIELFPNKFRDYLLSPEVGFSKCCNLGVPQHTSKGFRRPIQLYIKGDFTPSKARWSDAYAPSSHHKPEVEPPVRTVYAPVEPAYRPSDDAPSCGAATPYSPNLEMSTDDSPFYNPRSDSYTPSYAPPRPTVYATLPSPLVGGASPSPSPAASPVAAASPAPAASPVPEPLTARVYPAFSPCRHED